MLAQMKYGEDEETIADVPPLGCRVGKRNEDKGNPNEIEAGTVVEVFFKLTFDVLWDKGEKESFLVGSKDRTVVILDSAPAGVKHLHIRCDTCPPSMHGLEGTRWKCMECYDFDLCTSCYMNNKHNMDHSFIRFDNAKFNGYCVPPRSSSNEVIQSVGLFPGATVQRGPDWKWGEQDGGTGTSGKILNFEKFSNEQPRRRSGVRVRWSSGGNNCYRVGFNGKVDLKCVTAAKGLSYYWHHLLKCSVEPNESKPVFDYHQRVKCSLPMDLLEPLMQGHGGWDANIAEFIGQNGIVEGHMANNDVVVQYQPLSAGGSSARRRHVWIFHPASLEKSASDLARSVGQSTHGENAETILVAPQLGTRVGRRNEDEGRPNEVEAGTVVDVVFQLSFDVLWDKGERETFLVGCKSRTVVVLDCAPAGIRHPHVSCDVCSTSSSRIAGMRWKCMECYDYDLCTSCYMNNEHNTGHRFIRFDKKNFDGYCVPPRSSSNEVVQSIGFFPGATVQRGPDWKWGNEDGSAGNLGVILNLDDYSTAQPRSAVKVQWRISGINSYRVGYEGKVDLKCARAAKGLSYYWDHLRKCSVKPIQPKPIFDYHQKVKCTLPMVLLKLLMKESGEWDASIAEFVGKIGRVEGYMANNDVIVQYKPLTVGRASTGRRFVWVFHPGALEKSISAVPSQRTSSAAPVPQLIPSTTHGTNPRAPSLIPPSLSTLGQTRAPAATDSLSMCSSCDENYASVTFHPCGHILFCEVCSVHMKKCMTCKRSIESKTHVVIRKPVPAKQQTGDGAAGRQCEICMDKVKDTAFVPCGHGVCSECAGHVNQCHMCRAQIKSKIRTYF